MGVKQIIKNRLIKCGILSSPKSKEEMWRERGVTIGKNFYATDTSIDYCFGHLVTIGDNVTLSGVTILAHDATTKLALGYSKVGNVTIGNRVFVGYGSIILPNTVIGDNVIIGAGTIVTHDVPSNSVFAGNPGRVIGTYDDYIEKQKKRLETLPVSNIRFDLKTNDDKIRQREELQHTGGFDL